MQDLYHQQYDMEGMKGWLQRSRRTQKAFSLECELPLLEQGFRGLI